MLIPLTRKAFNDLIPPVGTGAQYAYYWGKLRDLLQRVLISVVGIFAVLLTRILLIGEGFDGILLTTGIVIGLYWIWGPVVWASYRNYQCRRYQYSGFWTGKVIDVYLTEELTGTEETVNNRGELVIVENRERCLNLEVGDRTGFSTQLQVPLKRNHRAIDVGDPAEMLVFSSRGDLGRIEMTSDIYIPDHNLWVSDYPFVQRDAFMEVRRRLKAHYQAESAAPEKSVRKRTPKNASRRGTGSSSDRYGPRDNQRRDSQRKDNTDRSDDYDRNYDEPEPPPRRTPRRRSSTDW